MKELVKETIALEYELAASPERVFRALTEEVGAWWTHAFKEGSRVFLEARPGGEFGERWEGGGALYATVTYLDPARKLRLQGPMGMAGATACAMEYELEALPGPAPKTRLRLVHDILGWIEPELPADYRAGWALLLGTSLRAHVEGAQAAHR